MKDEYDFDKYKYSRPNDLINQPFPPHIWKITRQPPPYIWDLNPELLPKPKESFWQRLKRMLSGK